MVGFPIKGVTAALLASLLVAGCVATRPAPVSERGPLPAAPPPAAVRPAPAPAPSAERPATYIVKKGDTLFSIALDHGVDHRDLAAWNNIEQARIRIGQELRLAGPPAAATTAPLKSAPARVEARPLGGAGTPLTVSPGGAAPPGGNVKVEPLAVHVPYSDQAYGQLASIKPGPAIETKPPPRPDTERGVDDLDWIWPTSGRVISGFNEGANLKGIAIAGKLGQPVLASAPGRVIFSGTGIRGFGKLIVIKHNNTFLSVYAHNHTLLVKEGQTVSKGQKIAEMGNSDTDQVKLHFEIRRFGKPVDPGKLLPERPV
jgi:lipoprotein NlpD